MSLLYCERCDRAMHVCKCPDPNARFDTSEGRRTQMTDILERAKEHDARIKLQEQFDALPLELKAFINSKYVLKEDLKSGTCSEAFIASEVAAAKQEGYDKRQAEIDAMPTTMTITVGDKADELIIRPTKQGGAS